MTDALYEPSRSLTARLRRRLVQWSKAAPDMIEPERPIVSFTFDDFPKSALRGADIVESLGGRACFYACTSYMGETSPVFGDMFDASTLAELSKRGHEIGAHTHAHLDCARTPLRELERDVGENLVALSHAGYAPVISSFAYPYGETTMATKRWTRDVFATARGILPGVNNGKTDRTHLRSVELVETPSSSRRAIAMLEKAVTTKGWLIFFTHDVSDSPSSYGVRPSTLAELARRAVDMGAMLTAPTGAARLCGLID